MPLNFPVNLVYPHTTDWLHVDVLCRGSQQLCGKGNPARSRAFPDVWLIKRVNQECVQSISTSLYSAARGMYLAVTCISHSQITIPALDWWLLNTKVQQNLWVFPQMLMLSLVESLFPDYKICHSTPAHSRDQFFYILNQLNCKCEHIAKGWWGCSGYHMH